MASGAVYSNWYTDPNGYTWRYALNWNTSGVNYSNNTSNFNYALVLQTSNATGGAAERSLTLNIGGGVVYTKADRVWRYPENIGGNSIVCSGTIACTHSADGTFNMLVGEFAACLYDSSIRTGFSQQYVALDTLSRKVYYNANGGSGAPATQSKNYNVTLKLSTTKPTRSGYTFKNWNTAANGSGTTYASGANFTSNAQSTTLYAQWTANTYTVSYNANGGSGAPSAQTKMHGINLTLSSTKPTRSGYIFMGWGTSASDTSADYAAGGSYTTNAAIILYAIWKKTITITYNANNGSGAPAAQSSDIYNATTSVSIKLSSTVPTRTNYTFLGWAKSSSATVADYAAGSTQSFSASTTLYAVWELNGYTITYNANGGTRAPSSQIKYIGTDLTLSSTVPTRKNYTFLGWATTASATSAEYAAGSSYTTEASATLYAVWSPYTHTIAYDANGGTNAPASQTKVADIPLTLTTDVPTRSGYNFRLWNSASDGSGASFSSGAVYTNEQDGGTVTLYATWSATDIFFYNTGTCKALQFVENDTLASAAMLSADGDFVVKDLVEE